MKHLVAPSILSADFAHLGQAIALLNDSQADWIHVDVMDGRFVPNISFAFPVLEAIKPIARKPLDVHLMIVEPDQYIERFHVAGADTLSVHYEACPNLHRTLQAIQSLGMGAGVAINPHTPVSVVSEVIEWIDLVIIMSVNPGYGGQAFIPRTYDKIRHLREMIDQSGSKALIEIDGGVTLENAPGLVAAGADILVAGSTVFNSPSPTDRISTLKLAGENTKSV